MRDEMRSAMARQGITEVGVSPRRRARLRRRCATQAPPAGLHAGEEPAALSEIAKVKGVEVPDADIEARGRSGPGLDMRTTAAWSSTSRANAAETTSGAR